MSRFTVTEDRRFVEFDSWWEFLGEAPPPGREPVTALRESMLNWVWSTGWTDELRRPRHLVDSGVHVIDDSVTGVGSKARFADLLFSMIEEKEVVYVQPRYGWAGISLCHLAKKYDKRLTLFMPASRRVSAHQLVTIERGAYPRFIRVAAMPVLNAKAQQYAEARGAKFLPLGLKHPVVSAAAVSVIHDLMVNQTRGVMWSVTSTGVLSRALQIALLPVNWDVRAVAVARNIHAGERGRAYVYSYDKPFAQSARTLPDAFDSAENYDAKGWELARELKDPNKENWFWNVAGNVAPRDLIPEQVNSYREWGDLRDFDA